MKTSKELINYFHQKNEENKTFAGENLSLLSERQTNWKPGDDIWSVGECIHHLIVSHRAYHLKIENTIKIKSETHRNNYPYEHSFIGKWIIKGVDPVVKKKYKTFKAFKPESSNFTKGIFNEFFKVQEEISQLVSKMKNMDLKKLKISSPANKLVRINLGDALVILTHHDARHLNQAIRIIQTEGFPNS